MSTTVSSGSTATFGMDAFASLAVVPSASDTRGTITFTSAAPNSRVPSFSAKLQAKEFGPFLVPMSVSIVVEDGSCTYQLTGNAGGYSYDSNNNVTGLVGPDGTVISFTGPAYTWAGKPSAADNAGNSIRITDVGPVGAGSVWISDGTNWRPIGGRVMHCAASGTVAAPLATLSGATGKLVLPAGDRVTAGSILMPVGLPQIGQGVEVSAKLRHRGTGGAWNAVVRLGSLDSASDPSFVQSTGTATDDQGVWLLSELEVVSATTFVASTYGVPNSAGVGSVVLRNTNFNNAAQLYLGFYSSTLNAADFLDLISYRVYFIG